VRERENDRKTEKMRERENARERERERVLCPPFLNTQPRTCTLYNHIHLHTLYFFAIFSRPVLSICFTHVHVHRNNARVQEGERQEEQGKEANKERERHT